MNKRKLKILELCEFSSGICGVWSRVKQEAELLSKKHEVYVFSSNIIKGTNKTAPSEEKINKIQIKRFPVKLKIGENALFWDFERQAIKLKPDVIITHVFRHPHSTKAVKIAKKINAKCFLVTHAPFVEKKLRPAKLNLLVSLYDFFLSKKILNFYDKVIAITKWEIPYLFNLGLKKNKIAYIPNGIPDEFFKLKKTKPKKNHALFLGRIAPIKNIETLIKAIKQTPKIKLSLVGPVEKNYKFFLLNLIKKLKLDNQIQFKPPVYDLKKKIEEIDNANIFILPSIREAHPIALIEAMARGKIVIAGRNKGTRELIKDKENGFLFEPENPEELAEKILQALNSNKKIQEQAIKTAETFKWSILIKKLNSLIKNDKHNYNKFQ